MVCVRRKLWWLSRCSAPCFGLVLKTTAGSARCHRTRSILQPPFFAGDRTTRTERFGANQRRWLRILRKNTHTHTHTPVVRRVRTTPERVNETRQNVKKRSTDQLSWSVGRSVAQPKPTLFRSTTGGKAAYRRPHAFIPGQKRNGRSPRSFPASPPGAPPTPLPPT